jgi:hypothetical protein
MKKWPYGDNLFIVYSEDTLAFKVQVLQKANNQFKVISAYSGELGEYRFKEFDFAPYTIKKKRTAIGIRFVAQGPTMGGSWYCTRLKLFEFADNNLALVLSTLVAYTAEGNNVAYDMDTYYSTDESAVIIIGKPDASGYNKIIKKVEKKNLVYSNVNGTYTEDNVSGYKGNLQEKCFCP